jgi:hypothetical protein
VDRPIDKTSEYVFFLQKKIRLKDSEMLETSGQFFTGSQRQGCRPASFGGFNPKIIKVYIYVD